MNRAKGHWIRMGRTPAEGAGGREVCLRSSEKVHGEARSGSGSVSVSVSKGQVPYNTGIDPDFDRTDRELCSWGGSFATEGTEFTERFFLLPSAGRSSYYQMGNGLRLCDLCGRNLLTRGRPKRSMAKQDRGRGGYRSRYRRDAGWDSETRNRIAQLYCCGADKTRQRGLSSARRAGCQPEQESIPIQTMI